MGWNAHDTDLYTIGKGILYFDRLDANGLPTGMVDLGNAPSVVLTPTVEKLKHFTSREQIKKVDKVVNLSIGITAKFTLDEYDIDNLAMALLGTVVANELRLLRANQVEGHLKFVGNNACGPNYQMDLWYCILQCNADVPFISDEWATMNFEAEVQDDAANHPDTPYGRLVQLGVS